MKCQGLLKNMARYEVQVRELGHAVEPTWWHLMVLAQWGGAEVKITAKNTKTQQIYWNRKRTPGWWELGRGERSGLLSALVRCPQLDTGDGCTI